MKQCKTCLEFKDRSEYWKYTKAPDKLQYRCKLCMAAQYKQWATTNVRRRKAYYQVNKRQIKHYALKRNFNLSLEQYEQMNCLQNGRCAICSNIPNKALSVDHCHQTGQIRDLLCLSCNALLGSIENGRVPIKNYFEYLDKHKKKTKKEKCK